MINKLIALDKFIDDNYVEGLSYDLHLDGVDVRFNYCIMFGWTLVYEAKKNFNACDYQTNLEGLDKEIKKIYKWLEDNHLEEAK